MAASCKAGPPFSILAPVPKDPDFGPSPLGSFAKCVRAALPRLNYLTQYRARVVRHDPVTHLLDVLPDDLDVPGMQGLPFSLGLPGAVLSLLPQGTTVMVGWSGGDPSQPYCCLPGGGEHVGHLTLNADTLVLGGEAGAESTIKADTYRAAEDAYLTAISAAIAALGAGLVSLGYSGAATAVGAVATAKTAFDTAAATYKTTNVRVK